MPAREVREDELIHLQAVIHRIITKSERQKLPFWGVRPWHHHASNLSGVGHRIAWHDPGIRPHIRACFRTKGRELGVTRGLAAPNRVKRRPTARLHRFCSGVSVLANSPGSLASEY